MEPGASPPTLPGSGGSEACSFKRIPARIGYNQAGWESGWRGGRLLPEIILRRGEPMRAMPRWFWILIGLAVASAMGAVLVFLYTHPAAAAVLRDILIIALAMQLTLLAAVTTFLIYRLIRLVDWLQEEVRPILSRAQETVNTVHGTSAFLSRRLARPAIEAASMAAGVAYALRTFVRLLRGRAS
jgi:hypothetical protein